MEPKCFPHHEHNPHSMPDTEGDSTVDQMSLPDSQGRVNIFTSLLHHVSPVLGGQDALLIKIKSTPQRKRNRNKSIPLVGHLVQ